MTRATVLPAGEGIPVGDLVSQALVQVRSNDADIFVIIHTRGTHVCNCSIAYLFTIRALHLLP